MNIEILMQYATYFLMAIGAMAFLVAVVVQVIKELPLLQRIPTSLVALAVSLEIKCTDIGLVDVREKKRIPVIIRTA